MQPINCTQCGAPVPIRGDGFTRCESCGSALYLDTRQLLLHYQLDPLLDAEAVRGRIRRWLHHMEVPGEVSISPPALQRWPFWEIERDGQKLLLLAASSTWAELESLDVSAGRRLPFDPAAPGETIEPTVLAAAALQRGGPPGAPAQLRLLHVPLYVARYRHGGRHYEALIDGIVGEVYAEDAPIGATSQLDRSHALTFALTTAIFALEAAFTPNLGWTMLAFAVTGKILHLFFQRRSSGGSR